MKKSQMVLGNIFIYIIGLLVVTFVLIMGYKAYITITTKGQEADYLQFRSQLESVIKLNKGYGDASTETLNMPMGYKEICFVSCYGDCIIEGVDIPTFTIPYIIMNPYSSIKDSVDTKIKADIFLLKNNNEMESFFINNIKVANTLSPPNGMGGEDNFGCIPSQGGKIKLYLEGLGSKTEISQG